MEKRCAWIGEINQEEATGRGHSVAEVMAWAEQRCVSEGMNVAVFVDGEFFGRVHLVVPIETRARFCYNTPQNNEHETGSSGAVVQGCAG